MYSGKVYFFEIKKHILLKVDILHIQMQCIFVADATQIRIEPLKSEQIWQYQTSDRHIAIFINNRNLHIGFMLKNIISIFSLAYCSSEKNNQQEIAIILLILNNL